MFALRNRTLSVGPASGSPICAGGLPQVEPKGLAWAGKVFFVERTAEEAIEAVTEPSQDDPRAAFGTNQWLVDEMYERYQADPDSLDPVWLEFFKEHSQETSTTNGGPAAPAANATAPPDPTPTSTP